jgi:hypothetical protein
MFKNNEEIEFFNILLKDSWLMIYFINVYSSKYWHILLKK